MHRHVPAGEPEAGQAAREDSSPEGSAQGDVRRAGRGGGASRTRRLGQLLPASSAPESGPRWSRGRSPPLASARLLQGRPHRRGSLDGELGLPMATPVNARDWFDAKQAPAPGRVDAGWIGEDGVALPCPLPGGGGEDIWGLTGASLLLVQRRANICKTSI